MNIDVKPIWKSPYFQHIKQEKEKKGEKKTILTSFPPVPPFKGDPENQEKLVKLV